MKIGRAVYEALLPLIDKCLWLAHPIFGWVEITVNVKDARPFSCRNLFTRWDTGLVYQASWCLHYPHRILSINSSVVVMQPEAPSRLQRSRNFTFKSTSTYMHIYFSFSERQSFAPAAVDSRGITKTFTRLPLKAKRQHITSPHYQHCFMFKIRGFL